MTDRRFSPSDELIKAMLPHFETLLGGKENIENFDKSVKDHSVFPRNALYIEYWELRRYLQQGIARPLWLIRAGYHAQCLKYCIDKVSVVDVDGQELNIDTIDYIADTASPERSIDILSELEFASQLPLNVDSVGLIAEIEKSRMDSPKKRPDILLKHNGNTTFIECKRAESKDNPSRADIQDDIDKAATSGKFRDEFYQGENQNCILQILVPHTLDYITNEEMMALLEEANDRVLGKGDRSEYISSVVSAYYTLQLKREERRTLFGPVFVETTSPNSDFKLGIESPIQDTIQNEPVYDVEGIAESE